MSEYRIQPYLASPQATKAVIKKYDFAFHKRYGQNFLINGSVLDQIVAAANITRDDFVLEIGPGIGTMTQYLAYAAREVTAVEIDKELIPILEDTLQGYPNVTILQNDILKVDLRALAEEKNSGQPIKIVANLPYYITTPILMTLLENHIPAESITVMVQKEVADRMLAGPGSKDYGALSLAIQYYTRPEMMLTVPPSCFMPQPKVASAVVRLTGQTPPIPADEALLFALIRAAFNQRRKTLANALNNAPNLHFSKNEISAAIAALNLPPAVRGEALTLEEFGRLADALSQTR